MQFTAQKIVHAVYSLESSSCSYSLESCSCSLHLGKFVLQFTPWKVVYSVYSLESTTYSLHIGKLFMQFTAWKASHTNWVSSLHSLKKIHDTRNKMCNATLLRITQYLLRQPGISFSNWTYLDFVLLFKFYAYQLQMFNVYNPIIRFLFQKHYCKTIINQYILYTSCDKLPSSDLVGNCNSN